MDENMKSFNKVINMIEHDLSIIIKIKNAVKDMEKDYIFGDESVNDLVDRYNKILTPLENELLMFEVNKK